jgi:hypothetical protein
MKVKNRRQWERFQISGSQSIRARIIDAIDRHTSIQTLSAGGCGFVSSRGNARLMKSPQIKVELKFGPKTFVIPGRVQYCRLMPGHGMDLNILGIEFEWPDSVEFKAFRMLLEKSLEAGALVPLPNPEFQVAP